MVKILKYASPEIEEQYKAQEDEDKPVVDTAEDTAVAEPKQQQPAVKGPRILRRAGEDTVAPISPQETLIAPAAQPSAPTGPSVPTGVTAEDIAAEEEKQKAKELEAIDPTIDYEAADAETDMPTNKFRFMTRDQMARLGMATPEKVVDTTTRAYRAKKENAKTAEAIASGAAEQGMSEYEFIRDVVVPSMPDKVNANGDADENGSPSLMKKFMTTPVLGPVFMQSLIKVEIGRAHV